MTVSSISVRVPPFCTPQPPRYWPGPPESGTIWWVEVTTGERRSWPSSGWTARPTPKNRGGGVRTVPAVAPAPAADHPVVPHEERGGPRTLVPTTDQKVLQVEAARERPVGHGLRPELEEGAHDLLVGSGAETCHGRGPGRIDDRVLRQMGVDYAVETGV